jgi:hypothetical protein
LTPLDTLSAGSLCGRQELDLLTALGSIVITLDGASDPEAGVVHAGARPCAGTKGAVGSLTAA